MIKNKKEAIDNNFAITRAAEEVRKLSFNDQICLGCGVCESTCPVEAITLNPIAIDARHRRSNDVYFSGHEKIAQNFLLNLMFKKSALMKINVFYVVCVVDYVQ